LAEPVAVRARQTPGAGRILLWLLALLPMLCSMERQVGYATCRSIADLSAQGAYGVADPGGRIIDSCNIDRSLVPASVLKIATVSAALAILGPDHRFRTEFYLDDRDNLYLKGFGDPTLVSEEIIAIGEQLRLKGLRRVQTLYVDPSAFALITQVPGQEDSDNPYDAPVGPLSVNFNSVPIDKDAAGRIVSGEALTPTLPIMIELGQRRPAGRFRVNICAQGCNPDVRMAQYAGELFRALLQQGGTPVAALGGVRSVPAQGARLFYTHQGRQTLTEISRSTLQYSSNFMANLMFLACGAKEFGYPATWKKAEQAVHRELARQLGEATADAIVQVEGAGLSRDNRVTARAMLQLLTRFRPQLELLKKERGAAVKTGTLTGVYNLAGYLPSGQAFVVLLNQQVNNRAAVLDRLNRQFGASSPAPSRQTVSVRSRLGTEK
jgi:D-alanyl-D-alanine carboxypeptidase/D-alanyl-D-alanine-endopeptidase (penicillin-binding protein 4)